MGGVFAAQAQDISFGVKGGLNVASMTDIDASSKISGHIGGFANFKFKKLLHQKDRKFKKSPIKFKISE